MGKKQLITNLIANIISFLASFLISFLLTPYLISTIGKEAYGFYPISTNFVSYLSIITLALNSMVSRFITVELVKKNTEKAKQFYSSAFYSNIVLTLILLIPMVLTVIYIESLMHVPAGLVAEVKMLFILVFVSMLIGVFTSVFSIATFARNRLDLRSGSELFQGFLKIALYIFLLSAFEPSLVFIGLVAFIQGVSNLIIQIFLTRKLLPGFVISFKYFDFTAVKQLLTSGIWNSINSLGSVLLLGVTLLLTNIFGGASAAGELAIAQTVPHFISSIISMLFSVFLPRITQVYAAGNTNQLVNEVKFSQKVISLLTVTPIALVIIFGSEFFSLWVPTENSRNLQMLSVISLVPLIIHGNMWTVYGLNIVCNKVRTPSTVLIGTGAVNILLSYISIRFLTNNITIILIISGIINIMYYFLFIPIYAAKQLHINKYSFHIHIIKSIVFTGFFVIASYLIKKTLVIRINSWIGLFLYGGIFGGVGIAINSLFILNRTDFSEIKLLIKRVIKDNAQGTADS